MMDEDDMVKMLGAVQRQGARVGKAVASFSVFGWRINAHTSVSSCQKFACPSTSSSLTNEAVRAAAPTDLIVEKRCI